MKNLRSSFPLFIAIVFLFSINAVSAQKGQLNIAYTVALTDVASRQFHVTTDIKNINQPQLDLALPTWTPGWYVVENYGKNVLRMKITDESGKRLPVRMSRKQTWNVDTRGIKQIRVEYDYSATVLALNQAKIADDFAFFTGIELFLEPIGHSNEPSSIRFEIPKDWKLITALKDTKDPMVFTAENYDTLVDAPVEMGSFDVHKFDVNGKAHYFVANPAGTFSQEKSLQFTEMMTKVSQAQSDIFGGLPYEKYVHFYFFAPPESNASGALEHLNSFVAFAPPGEVATPEQIIGTASHEFFHLWNVKRIRPAEMWPYDYSRENETSLLWVSEGFTNYYGIVAVYRAGLMSEKQFIARAAEAAEGVETTDARSYISPANSSVGTWMGYDSPQAFSISYYTQGQNLAALLDLSIRNDTNGKSSLDDIMRTLFNDFYKKNKGFRPDDLLAIINKLTGKNYGTFFDKYVYGTDVPDYAAIFGYAGLNFEKKIHVSPVFGFSIRNRNGGMMVNSVTPETPADKAGFKVGDVILKINGKTPSFEAFQDVAGKTIQLTIARDGKEMELPMAVGSRDVESYELSEMSNPTAKQKTIRDGWLKRKK